MKTIVYQVFQEFQGNQTPSWLSTCMQTVKNWAELKGYDYQKKDNFIDYIPDWYIDKAQGNINLVSDLARLEMARKFLESGYDRAIWLDADILIFAADKLIIDTTEEYLFCPEVYLETEYGKNFGEAPLYCIKQVTNSFTYFTPKSTFLDFYIDAIKSIVKNQTSDLSPLAVGTRFLSHLNKILKLPLFLNVGLFSPILMHGIAEDKSELVELYAKELIAPVYAANLCFSLRNQSIQGIMMTDKLFEQVINKLIKTKGEIINHKL